MILYYTQNGQLHANPIKIIGKIEHVSPIWNEKPLPQHKNISDVALTSEGGFYTFYNNDGTVNQVKEDEKNAEDALAQGEEALIAAIDAITVTYNGNTFSGSFTAQERMTVAITKLTGKLDTKTQNWFTVESKKIKLTKDDLINILDLIEPLMEAITDI